MAYKKETMERLMLAKKFKTFQGAMDRAGSLNASAKPEYSYQIVRFRENGERVTRDYSNPLCYAPFKRSDYWKIEKVRRET